VDLGLVPFGSIGLTLFALDLALASPHALSGQVPTGLSTLLGRIGTWRILADLLLIGLFGGLFIVPLYALVQMRSPEDCRARIIATNNIMNALFMVVGSLLAAGLLAAGLSIPTLFAVAGLGNAAVAAYIYSQVPEFLVRFLLWLALGSAGRIEARGLEQLPEQGAALLVLETEGEIGPLDVFMVMAACRRPIRFVIEPRLAWRPLARLVLGRARTIIGGHGTAQDAIQAGREALTAGQLVLLAHNPIHPGLLVEAMTVPVFRLTLKRPGGRRGPWPTRELRVAAMPPDLQRDVV
jgi:hypothetical protein